VKEEVYGHAKKIEKLLKKIKNSDFPEENKKALLDFYQECVLRGMSKARTLKYLTTLELFARRVKKRFSEMKKEDVANFITMLEEGNYAEWTKHDFKVMIRIFFKWLRGTDQFPEEVSWIRINNVNKVKLPEELLTEEEVMKLVDAAEHLRDKALILTLYESGCRIGELLTMRIKNVHFDEYGAVLNVNGKTGQRRVRIIFSAPKLMQWVENHPMRDNPEAPLWITIGMNHRYTPLRYSTVKDVIKKAARKAGIKKRVYPHLFRHSRATHLAKHLTEAQMKQYFGWVQGSDMASVYVHLSGRDVDDALLRLNGMKADVKHDTLIKTNLCPRCNSANSPDAKFCSNCGMCLDPKTAMELDTTREKVDRLMNELIKNPEVLEAMLKTVQRIMA
jgi:site-specific recombinase XerD/ribosomal protein L40E